MTIIMNNLFNFAHKELSQDAFICWCLNFVNSSDKKERSFGLDMLKLVLPSSTITSEDYSSIRNIKIETQFRKIDILVYVPHLKAFIIIEDKVYSSERENQIKDYRDEIQELLTKKSSDLKMAFNLEDSDFGQNIKIYTCYFKTGFHYDNDKKVVADKKVDGKRFQKVIEDHKDKIDSNSSYLINMYYQYLVDLISWYNKHDDFWGINNTSAFGNERNISKHQIAQYRFLKFIFPDIDLNHGSNNGGRPWSHACIKYANITDFCASLPTESEYDFSQIKDLENKKVCLFWRVDTDKNGPYLSLRFYDENFDKKKNNDALSVCHKKIFNDLKEIISKLTQDGDLKVLYQDLKDLKLFEIALGDKDYYKECPLIHITITKLIDQHSSKEDSDKHLNSLKQFVIKLSLKLGYEPKYEIINANFGSYQK